MGAAKRFVRLPLCNGVACAAQTTQASAAKRLAFVVGIKNATSARQSGKDSYNWDSTRQPLASCVNNSRVNDWRCPSTLECNDTCASQR